MKMENVKASINGPLLIMKLERKTIGNTYVVKWNVVELTSMVGSPI